MSTGCYRFPRHHGDERDPAVVRELDFPRGAPGSDHQPLVPGVAPHRGHEAPAGSELVEERFRNLRRRRRDHDAVEGRRLRPAPVAVSHPEVDPVVAGGPQRGLGARGQPRQQFDGPDLDPDLGEDRRLVARSRADLEHPLPRPQPRQRTHQRHDVRLGNRLLLADRERTVGVGVRALGRRDEPFAGHRLQRPQHRPVADAAGFDLAPHHQAPLLPEGPILFAAPSTFLSADVSSGLRRFRVFRRPAPLGRSGSAAGGERQERQYPRRRHRGRCRRALHAAPSRSRPSLVRGGRAGRGARD